MTTKARTTHSREGKDTVAEEGSDAPKDQTGEPATKGLEATGALAADVVPAEQVPDGVDGPGPVAGSGVTQPEDLAEDKGMCDNHPDRQAILVTDFPWLSTQQRFCNLDVPSQYRYLL